MGQLTAELYSKNLTIPIVAELEDLTVGMLKIAILTLTLMGK